MQMFNTKISLNEKTERNGRKMISQSFYFVTGPSGRERRPRRHGDPASGLSRSGLDPRLRSLWPFGRASQRRMQDCASVSHASGGIRMRIVHSGPHCGAGKLSRICAVRLDLRYGNLTRKLACVRSDKNLCPYESTSNSFAILRIILPPPFRSHNLFTGYAMSLADRSFN